VDDEIDDLGDILNIPPGFGDIVEREDIGQIAAGTEGPAGPGEDHRPHRGIFLDLSKGHPSIVEERLGHGIQRGGIVHGNLGDVADSLQ